MVLDQDLAQYEQSARVVAEREYRRDLAKYEQDLKEYEAEKKRIEAENKKKKEQYEKELAAYNKQVEEQRKKEAEEQAKQKQSFLGGYDSQLAELTLQLEQKQKAQAEASARPYTDYESSAYKNGINQSKLRNLQRDLRNEQVRMKAYGDRRGTRSAKISSLQKQISMYQSRVTEKGQKLAKSNTITSLGNDIKNLQLQITKVGEQRTDALRQYQEKQKRESQAKSAITSAGTEYAYKQAIWQYRKTDFVSSRGLTKPYMTKAVSNALAQVERARKIGKGSAINRASSVAERLFMGWSMSDIQADMRAEDANRKLAKSMSAGLRASGNIQINTAIQKELARLGGSSTSGPTKISGTLNTTRAPVAKGTAAIAQPWEKGFTTETKAFGYIASGQAEIDRQNQIKMYNQQKAIEAQTGYSVENQKANPMLNRPMFTPLTLDKTMPSKPMTKEERMQARMKGVKSEEQQRNKAMSAFMEPSKPQPSSFSLGSGFKVPRNVPMMLGALYTIKTSDGEDLKNKRGFTLQFKSEESANKYLDILQKNKGASYVGYGPDGSPIQGPAKPKSTESSFPFPIAYGNKERERTQSFSSNKDIDNVLFGIDQSMKNAERFQKSLKDNTVEKGLAGIGMAFNSLVAGTINTATTIGDGFDKYVMGKPEPLNRKLVTVPGDIGTSYSSGAIEDITQGKFTLNPTEGKGASEFMKQWEKQDLATNIGQSVFMGGMIALDALTAKGALTATTKGLKIGSELISMPVKGAKTNKGALVKDAVIVGREYKLFGRTFASKAYKNPTIVKMQKDFDIVKSKPVDSSGSISKGPLSPSKIMSQFEFQPQGRGYEIFTGTKAQTRFNLGVTEELVKQGKLSQTALTALKEIQEGVTLAKKPKPQAYQSIGEAPITSLTKPEFEAVNKGINILQSPLNWFKGRTRVGNVGGSASQQIQLRPQYTKKSIHDYDIDVKSEKIAVRGAKTVFDQVKKVENVPDSITLSPGRATKVQKDGDEFIEFLSPKDVKEGNLEAATSGLRFGEKYRSDSFRSIFDKKIKDPEYGFKVRDIRDQTVAKASSVASIQGKYTEKFKGVGNAWETKQNILTDKGILRQAPPALRGKDTVDLYRIFKSKSEELIQTNKVKEGQRLDEIAENLRKRDPELPYDENIRQVSLEVSESKSVSKALLSNVATVRPPVNAIRTEPSQTRPKPRLQSSISSPSIRSIPKMPSMKSVISSRSPSNIRSSSPRISSPSSIRSTSLPRISSPSRPSPSSRPSVFSPKSPSVISPSSPSSPSVFSPGSPPRPRIKSPSRTFVSSGKTTVVMKTKKKPIAGLLVDIKNTEKKSKDKPTKRKDFLGNTRLDNIEGLFKRKEIIVGDKKTARQLRTDKKFKLKRLKF